MYYHVKMQKNKTCTDFLCIDSGSGGLPYLLYLLERFPGYSSVYVADTENFPYGKKSKEKIVEAITALVERLLEHFEPKIIIIACNTISVTALDILRSRFSIPFVGTVPAIKQAVQLSKNKIIGLLATENTVASPYTDALFLEYASEFRLVKRGDAKLVRFVEKSLHKADEKKRKKALKPALAFFEKNNIDVLILGCTHFIHLINEIKKIAPPHWQILDSRAGVINRAIHIANEKGIVPRLESKALFYATKQYSASEERLLRSFLEQNAISWQGLI